MALVVPAARAIARSIGNAGAAVGDTGGSLGGIDGVVGGFGALVLGVVRFVGGLVEPMMDTAGRPSRTGAGPSSTTAALKRPTCEPNPRSCDLVLPLGPDYRAHGRQGTLDSVPWQV
jgi:hypothetical protein